MVNTEGDKFKPMVNYDDMYYVIKSEFKFAIKYHFKLNLNWTYIFENKQYYLN